MLTSTGGGNISFGGTVDGAYSLETSTSGATIFGGVVGTTALTSLTVDAGGLATQINGGSITTTGAQTYNNAVTLGADATLTSTGSGNIDFAGTIDGLHSLTVNTAGTTTFGGVVGGTNPLVNLTTDAAGSTDINTTTITTSGAQTYNDAVALGANTTTTLAGSTVTFGSMLDDTAAAGPQMLSITGNTTFDGQVGSSLALARLTVDGTADLNGGAITTTGNQVFEGAVTLSTDNTLTVGGGAVAAFYSTLNGAKNLTIDGSAEFYGAVGGTAPLSSLHVGGISEFFDGTTITTTNANGGSGNQTYSGAATLYSNGGLTTYTFKSTGGTVDFQGGVDGTVAGEETLAVTGNAEFDTSVGSNFALGSLSVSGMTIVSDAISVTTTDADGASGNQTYTGNVSLGANLNDTYTFNSTGGLVDFGGQVNGTYSGEEVLAVNGNAEFDGNVGSASVPLASVFVGGTTKFDGTVTTLGDQTYTGAVTLATDETLTSTAGSIDFVSTVDATSPGGQALTVNATAGTVTFGATVGGTPLSSLTAEGSSVVVDGSITAANNVFLQGSGITFAGGGVETLASGMVSLQADTLTFNGAETVNTGTLEYAPFTPGTAVTLGFGGVLPATNLTIDANALRVGAVTDPLTSTLDTTAGSITIAAGGFSSPSTDLDLETTGAISGGPLFANTLTGNADSLSLTDSNDILTLGSFTAANNFTLNDNTQLTITGPLTSTNGNIVLTGGAPVILDGDVSASGSGTQIVAFETGDITQTGGSLIADELTGLALSASFTQAGNKVGTLEAFETINGFTLNDSIALTVAGNSVSSLGVPAGVQTTNGNITLTTTGTSQDITLATTLTANNAGQDISLNASGNIDQTSGHILATELSGSAGGTVTLGGPGPTTNQDLIASLGTFTAGGNFDLVDSSALTVSGAVSSTSGNIGIQTNGTSNGITIATGGSLSAAGGGSQVVLLQSAGAITESGGGTIAADELMMFAQGDISLMSAGNQVATLEGVSATGNVYLADASALDVAGNNVSFDTFILPITNITAGAIGGTGDVYLESANASGISFGEANSVTISASTSGLVSVQADAVNFGSHGTAFEGGTFEYAPATTGATATLGATGGLISSGAPIAYGVDLVRVGAVTIPGTGETTTAGAISVAGAFSTNGLPLELDTTGAITETAASGVLFNVSTLTGNAASLDLTPDENTIGSIGNFTTTGAFDLLNGNGQALSLTGALNAGSVSLTDANGIIFATGGSVTTTGGGQTYASDVTLASDTVLADTGGGTVDFQGLLDGGFNLTITGNAEFDGTVGGTPLASLSVSGTTAIDTTAISTTGTQTYTGAVTLGSDTTLTGSAVSFDYTIDGTQALTVDGAATFKADIGDTAHLTSLTVNGTTAFDGTVTTTGDQTYNGAVTLNTDQTLTSTMGSIDFVSTVDAASAGGEALTVSAANGTVTFGGNVGAGEALDSLTATANAMSLVGSITTENNLSLDVTGTGNLSTGGALLSNAGNITLQTASGDIVLNASVTASNNDGQIVTLVSGGKIKQMTGALVADELTGSSVGDALLQNPQNSVGTLEAFQVGGNFDLQTGLFSGRSLTVAGNDVSTLGFTGVTAGHGNTTGNLVIDGGPALTLTGNVTAESTGGSQAVKLQADAINQTGGVVTANSLSLIGLNGSVTLNQANQVGVLTGSATGDLSFTDAQALTVNDVISGNLTLTTTGSGNGITLTGDLSSAAGQIATLVSAAGIDQTSGSITADELTGSSVGDTSLTGGNNQILTLEAFQATGNFSLTDARALTVSGADVSTLGFTGVTAGEGGTAGNLTLTTTGVNSNLTLASNLNASSGNAQIVTLVSSGTINQTGGAITADELTGSSVGDTTLARSNNSVGTLEAFQAGGNLGLFDASSLTVAGDDVSTLGFTGVTAGYGNTTGNLTLKTTGDLTLDGNVTARSGNAQIVTLVSSGAIDQTGGALTADELTGSSVGDTTLTQSGNFVLGLEAFQAGGNFSLTEGTTVLTVYGTDVSSLGFTGVTAGYGNTAGDVTLKSSIAPIILDGNLTAPDTVDLEAVGEISQTGGIITANTLTGSVNGGPALLNDGNLITTLGDFSSVGELQFTNAQALTVAGTVSVNGGVLNLTTTSGDLTVTGTLSSSAGGGPIILTSAGKIDESAGTISGPDLLGSSNQDAILTGDNSIGILTGFTVNNSGNFTLLDNSPLIIGGVSAPGNIFIGMAAGEGITTAGALASTGNGLVSLQTDALTIGAGTTFAGSTFEYAPTTADTTVTLGSGAANFSNATLNVDTVRIGAVTEPGATNFTTTAGAITVADDQDFGGVNVDFETTGAVTGTAGAITDVGQLTGNAASVALSDTSNSINSLGNFSTTGDFTLADSTNLSIAGALNAGTHTVDLEITGTLDENGSAGTITAGELTGNSGSATLNGANDVPTLGDFNTHNGNFTLDDMVALSITGALNAGTGTVDLELGTLTVDEDNGAGAITAGTLTGNSGAATLTGANAIGSLGDYNTHNGDFTLDNTVNLSITGTLNAGTATVDLEQGTNTVDEDAGTGVIEAAELTGNSGAATLTGANVIPVLGDYDSHNGGFTLDDTVNLSIQGTLNAGTDQVDLELGSNTLDENGGTGAIDAAVLTGQAGSVTLDSSNNAIGAINGFTAGGDLTLVNDEAMTITGTLDVSGYTLTLTDTGGGIDASAGVIEAATLTGSTTGDALFTDASNAIGTLAGFTNTGGAFSLTDSVPLTITGTLNATGQTVTLIDSTGGIDASAGIIEAATLTGSAGGDALFTDASNAIGTLAGFTDPTAAFSLTDSVALTITGTLDPTTVTLVDTGGGIDASGGAIIADTLTGSTAGDAIITNAGNAIGTLADFTNTSGDFSLADSTALTITGTLNATGHTVTLNNTGGGIDASAGVIEANELTGSSAGQALFTDASNAVNTLGSFSNTSGQFSLTDTAALTVTGTLDATGQALTFTDTGGGVDASAATVNAAVLQGSTDGAATFTGAANQIGAVGFFTNTSGAFSLTDNTPLVIGATLDATGQTVTLIDTAGGIDGSVGEIKAATLTGSSTGDATFTGSNVIGTLAGFETNGNNFSLTDSTALTITGTLDAAGQTVTLADTGGGIDASAGEINAATLMGSSIGDALFTDASNSIGTLNGFSNTNGAFSLTDTTALTITGTLNATGQVVTLNDTGGGIDASNGAIDALALTGSTAGDATFTDVSNAIGTLNGFTNTSGAFSLTDSDALTINGVLDATGQTVTLDVTASSFITIPGVVGSPPELAAINASQGQINAQTLTGTTNGAVLFDDDNAANQIHTLAGFTNTSGAFTLTDSVPLTVTGVLNAAGQTVTLIDTGGGIDASAGQIIAGTLTGSANGDALFTDSANKIGTFANFTDDAGSVSLTDSIFLTMTGTLDPTTVTLVDTGGGIDASGSAIIADTLTGSTNGVATFTNAGNDIGTLDTFTNTQGAFSLTDSVALKITGTLNATHQTVTLVDTGGGIDASQGVIDAATLTGSTKGAATFTNAANAIGTLGGFETNGNVFTLTDSTALAMTGTLDANGQTVTLVDTGGAIDASHGVINAATLTGSTKGDATFTANNTVGVLDAFKAGGSLSLTDAEALAINGADISGLGFTGVSAGTGATDNLTVNVTGALTLASNIAAGGTLALSSSGNVTLNSGTIAASTVDITAAGNYTQAAGSVTGSTKASVTATSGNLTINGGSTSGATIDLTAGQNILLNSGTITGGTVDIMAADNYTQAAGTVSGTTTASITATSGNLIINGGSISGATIDLTAGQNILIGEQAFTALALNDDPGSINQIKDPILPVNVGANGGFYEATAAYHDHVFLTAATLNLTAPQRIVSENTGTLPQSGGGYAPNGIVINQQTTPLPTAISIDGGASGSSLRPQVADLFAVLMQGTSIIGAEDIADSAQIVFGPDTSKNNAYQINGCIIHNLNSCTIVGFTIKPMDPNKQADLVIIPGGDQDEDELDLTISGEGNDEIWEDEE